MFVCSKTGGLSLWRWCQQSVQGSMSVSPSICQKCFLSTICLHFIHKVLHTRINANKHTQMNMSSFFSLFFPNIWQETSLGWCCGADCLFIYILSAFLLCNVILFAKQLCWTSCLCLLCGFVCVHFVLTRTVNQGYEQVIHITVRCVFNSDCSDCNSPLASASSVNLIALSSCLHSVKFLAFHLLLYEESVSGRHTIFWAAGAT